MIALQSYKNIIFVLNVFKLDTNIHKKKSH